MIVTLCGSARFEAWFHMWVEALGLAGHATFGLCSYPSWHKGEKNWYTEEEKVMLDRVHFDKIRVSDAVLLLNVFGYLGESSLRELSFAQKEKKKVYALESWGEGVETVNSAFKAYYRDTAARLGVPELYRAPLDTMAPEFPYAYDLLGPGGPSRSSIVERLYQRKCDAYGGVQIDR